MRPADHRGHDGTDTPAAGWVVRLITSVKLAVALIAYLVVASIASTLVPGWGTRFFTSIAFLLPAAAFFVNLAACTIQRFARELRRPSRRRHGPDVLHLGLMVLVVGAVISYQGKRAGTVSLAPGESATLPDGATLTVTDFRADRYPDGRPKDWVSTLRVTEGDVVALDGFALRVNRPLRRAGYSYYQSSYGEEWQLALRDGTGEETVLHEGEGAEVGGTAILFMALEKGAGTTAARAVVRIGNGSESRVQRAGAGDALGGAEVTTIRNVSTTVIEAVRDPGWPVVAAALALIAIGTALTFLQKLREAS
jgi:cytochrome c biogenesis protein